MTPMHGTFVWYELMTTDLVAARAFYEKVLGWTSSDFATDGFDYWIFSAGEARIAGVMPIPAAPAAAGMPPNWGGYIGVDDVDASAAKARELGGQIHKGPEDIPGVGRFAVMTDPEGAMTCLFKPMGSPPPAVAPGTPGHAGWRELMAGDWTKAFEFYSALFGWQKGDAVDMGPMGIYQLFTAHGGGEAIGGMMTKPAEVPRPFWNYYFVVDAIDAAAARVTAAGGRVINGPHEVPGGSWILQCLDPQGAMVCFVSSAR